MEQRSSYAAVKDAQIKSRREECASNTEQRGQRNDATAKDAQMELSKEECA